MKNLEKYKNKDGGIWLNIASSSKILDGYMNFDNHIALNLLGFYSFLKWSVPGKYKFFFEEYIQARQKGTIIRHNCKKRLPLPDESADHILCSHFLEHIYPCEAEAVLRDFYRVLKKNGTIHIIVPNLEYLIKCYHENKKKKIVSAADEFVKSTLLAMEKKTSLKFRMLEMHGGFGLQHHWIYDCSSMAVRIRDAGFEILEKNETPSKDYRHNDCSLHIAAAKR